VRAFFLRGNQERLKKGSELAMDSVAENLRHTVDEGVWATSQFYSMLDVMRIFFSVTFTEISLVR